MGSLHGTVTLPALPTRSEVETLLRSILPLDATGHQTSYAVMSSVVWVALYTGAIGRARYIRPTMVCWMRDEIAQDQSTITRNRYWSAASRSSRKLREAFPAEVAHDPWYADNTREVIRDDILRYALWSVGAVLRDESVPTTSPQPVWTLESEFAALFQPSLTGAELDPLIRDWQTSHLSEVVYGRLRLVQARHTSLHEIQAVLPSGACRSLGAGLSSQIVKGVVEKLLPLLLQQPRVLAISESRSHILPEDARRLSELGLVLRSDLVLPDIVATDLNDKSLWLIEVVATDGLIDELRRSDLTNWVTGCGWDPAKTKFATAFVSRTAQSFRKNVARLAHNSVVWFLDEPQLLLRLNSIGSAD